VFIDLLNLCFMEGICGRRPVGCCVVACFALWRDGGWLVWSVLVW